jgi:hypothetical protein
MTTQLARLKDGSARVRTGSRKKALFPEIAAVTADPESTEHEEQTTQPQDEHLSNQLESHNSLGKFNNKLWLQFQVVFIDCLKFYLTCLSFCPEDEKGGKAPVTLPPFDGLHSTM